MSESITYFLHVFFLNKPLNKLLFECTPSAWKQYGNVSNYTLLEIGLSQKLKIGLTLWLQLSLELELDYAPTFWQFVKKKIYKKKLVPIF